MSRVGPRVRGQVLVRVKPIGVQRAALAVVGGVPSLGEPPTVRGGSPPRAPPPCRDPSLTVLPDSLHFTAERRHSHHSHIVLTDVRRERRVEEGGGGEEIQHQSRAERKKKKKKKRRLSLSSRLSAVQRMLRGESSPGGPPSTPGRRWENLESRSDPEELTVTGHKKNK